MICSDAHAQAERRALEASAETEGAAAGGDHNGPASHSEPLMADPAALAAEVRIMHHGVVGLWWVLAELYPCRC